MARAIRIASRVSPEVKEQLEALSAKLDRSESKIIELAVKEFIERHNRAK